MNLRCKIEVICQTDVGRVRHHNEDYVSSDERLGLAVLADGMGGLNAGEVASSMTVHLLMDELSTYIDGESDIGHEVEDIGLPLRAQVVHRAIDKGLYTIDEARASSKKNVVTRALGVAPQVEPEVHEHKVKQGDVYLMCSDGLTDLVADADIEKSFQQLGANLSVTAGHLVEVANASGGKDNISVVLIRIIKAFPDKVGFLKRVVDWFK
jgi:serine/threonine protein phosphatase PrpC